MQLGIAGLGLCAISAAVASSPGSHATAAAAFGHTLLVGVPLAVGLFAATRKLSARFGWILVAAACVSFLTTLAESDGSLLYSIGRVSYWLLEPLLIYLVLSFPTGRLEARVDRALVGAAVAVVATLYLPTALLTDHYPLPAPVTSCTHACPHNAFAVLHAQPAVVEDLFRPVREALTALLFAGATLRVVSRMRRASRLTRLTLSPVFAVASARLVVLIAALGVRRADPGAAVLSTLSWVVSLAIPALALGFLLGLVRWRLYVGNALETLATRLRVHPRAEELRAALAEAFDDPELGLAYYGGNGRGRWLDSHGAPASLSETDPRVKVTYVEDEGRPVAAITHDAALTEHPDLTDAAASYALIALENGRLTAEVQAALREVNASRARMVATADEERQRIERDLHDGAQQRLVALRMRLELAEELAEQDPEHSRERIHAVGEGIGEALNEIRNLARGVYPPLLAEQGLAEALRATAMQAPVATRVAATGVHRHPEAIERAIYFCCLEALQNAAKHARGATAVTITVVEKPDALSIDVRDNGAGFDRDEVPAGTGITNMVDRLAAVGGQLEVRSVPGRGTDVHGLVPLVAT